MGTNITSSSEQTSLFYNCSINQTKHLNARENSEGLWLDIQCKHANFSFEIIPSKSPQRFCFHWNKFLWGRSWQYKTYKTVMQIHEAKLTLELQTDWALYHDVCDLRIHSNSKIWLKLMQRYFHPGYQTKKNYYGKKNRQLQSNSLEEKVHFPLSLVIIG